MKRFMVGLIIGIPLASVLFGAVMAYFATHTLDGRVIVESEPLSKTSWQAPAQRAEQDHMPGPAP
jgi:hypothetical protein